MNNAAFGKTMKNVRKHRDIKLITTDKKKSQLASESNYHTTKYFSENLVAIEMKKKEKNVTMNKPIYLGMSVLDISKTLMKEFWHDYVKPKYQDRAKLCYMDTDSFLFILKLKIFLKTLQILIIASILTLHPFRILIKGDSGSGKTNALLSLINNQLDIDKIYFYAKDSYEGKYQFLITKKESTGLKHLNDPKAFIEYWNDMQDVYKNIEVYGVDKERKMLIVFDMIADVIKIKKIN